MTDAKQDLYYVPESLRREFSSHEMTEFLEQFKQFDTSGDGGVDAMELNTMMKSMNVHMEEDELRELIAKVDDNQSGQIEFGEFVRMMSNLRRGQASKLSKFFQMAKKSFEIRKECQDLMTTCIEHCRVEPFPHDMRQWHVYLDGPPGTPYEGGTFCFHFKFGFDYPYEPPQVVLCTRIYHVNFIMLLDGTAAIEWLPAIWTPDWRAKTLIECLLELFHSPRPEWMVPIYTEDNPYEFAIATDKTPIGTTARSIGMDCFNQFVQEREAYDAMAQTITMQYAKIHSNVYLVCVDTRLDMDDWDDSLYSSTNLLDRAVAAAPNRLSFNDTTSFRLILCPRRPRMVLS